MTDAASTGGLEGCRILLSAALLARRDLRITGVPGDSRTPEYKLTLIESLSSAAEKYYGASIKISGADITLEHTEGPPRDQPCGIASISLPAGIPLAEIILFLSPALFHARFRSVLNIEGSTHAGRSMPLTFVRDTLFDAMACSGFSAGINLNRFGFASGGGSIECRVYPAEALKIEGWQRFSYRRISKARVYTAALNQRTAPMQKKYISAVTGLDEKNISVLEIMNAPGIHNSVYIHVETERYEVIFFKEIDAFNMDRDDPAAAEKSLIEIESLAAEVKKFFTHGVIPPLLERELLLYAMLSGSEYEPRNEINIPLARSLEKILFP